MEKILIKIILWIILICCIFFIMNTFVPENLDIVCSTDNSTLVRLAGTWVCGNSSTEGNNTYNNITIYNITGGNITGGGTTNYIPLFTNSTNLDNSVMFQNNSKLGINNTNPQYTVDVTGEVSATKFIGDGSLLTNLPSASVDLFKPEPRIYKQKYDFESTTAGYTTIWVPTTISSGTAPVLTAQDWEHYGLVNITVASGTAGSGYAFQQSNAGSFRLNNLSFFYAVIKPQCQASSANISEIRVGYQDSFTSARPVDAVMFNITQNTTTTWNITPTTINNSIATTNTTYGIACNNWISLQGVVVTPKLAQFALYDVNGVLLTTWNIYTNIPTQAGRETSSAIVAYTLGARYSTLGHTVLDYFEIGVNKTIVR